MAPGRCGAARAPAVPGRGPGSPSPRGPKPREMGRAGRRKVNKEKEKEEEASTAEALNDWEVPHVRDTDEWTHPGQQVKVERRNAATGRKKKVWVWTCCQFEDYPGANGCTPPPGPRHHPGCLLVPESHIEDIDLHHKDEEPPGAEELLSEEPSTPCTWDCCDQQGGDWSDDGGLKLPNAADIPGCTTGLDRKGKEAAIQATAAIQEIFASAKALLLEREDCESAEQLWSAIAELIDAAQDDAAAVQNAALRWNLVGKRREQADLREFFSEVLPRGEAAALFVASKKKRKDR